MINDDAAAAAAADDDDDVGDDDDDLAPWDLRVHLPNPNPACHCVSRAAFGEQQQSGRSLIA